MGAPLDARTTGKGFERLMGALVCDGVSAAHIADVVGTPAYVYSAHVIRAQYHRLVASLSGIPHRLHFSVKANGNLAVLRLMRGLGAGVDVVSGGELFRALAAGFAGPDIVFSGVGKSLDELRQALDAGVKLINVESEAELVALGQLAAGLGRRAAIALRVNPEVTVRTPHPYTRTGERGQKFGIPYDEVLRVAKHALTMGAIDLVGLDVHIGSQIVDLHPYEDAMHRLLSLVGELRLAGATRLAYLDVGGGLGVTYADEPDADVEAFGQLAHRLLAPTGLEIVVEPGRFIVGNAGLLLTRVLYRKHSGGKNYIITDAGMTELLRPSHYDAFHRIETVAPCARTVVADVVGPVCESGDFLALDREVGDVQSGDLLAVHSAGAYGFVMSSNYNARPRSAEVIVDAGRFAIARHRETYGDLIRGEAADPAWSRP
ncbi:MAG: diaminopimelate decarboxylase [Gemmatimonadaceae bacterium]